MVCTCADSYVETSARETGAAAELAAARKMAKYFDLSDQYTFYPVAVQTLDPFNETAYELGDLDKRIAIGYLAMTVRVLFLFQCLPVVVQRFNSILLHDRFLVVDHPD